MTTLLQLFIVIPFFGYIISLLIPKHKETLISRTAFITVGLHLLGAILFVAFWLLKHHLTLDLKDFVLFESADYAFFLDFYFDKITAVYLLVGAFLTFLVTVYSRYYLHRESGYKRFFNTILIFYLGYNIIIFSGNLETLFIGWEILGISSFLLIAFYRERYLPVRNAVKVFSIYRFGDVGLILAMWMSHHMWNENITFSKLNDYVLVHSQLQTHSLIGVFISLMILVSAAVKSAQLPFSSWLPRAMEGPTPSSAIFYGSLSVHLGVFILLRTYTFWEYQLSVRILIGALGLITSIVTASIARVQSSVKSQIAYGSISQIGLIFIEVAAGFENLALFHFAGNAFLRTYQLLVSPSSVSYLIKEQFYNFVPQDKIESGAFFKKVKNTLYVLSLKEWNLDSFMFVILWNPLRWTGKKLSFLNEKGVYYFFVPAYIIGLASLFMMDTIPPEIHEYFPAFFALLGWLMVIKSFTERKNIFMGWILIVMNHFWIVLAISFNEQFGRDQALLYLSGAVVSGIVGYLSLLRIKKLESDVSLDQFHGHAYEHPKIALVFLLSGLGLMGFPISSTFIGEDLIYSHIHENQPMLALFTSLSFIMAGLAVVRMYSLLFLGPHIKTYHETAHRSS
jgi:NADH-quinone oxidoreductase subunit L